jgi:hypothetical protein
MPKQTIPSQYFLKIKKLGSFFDFQLTVRGMYLPALILGFAGDIIMNHNIDFLLLKLDLTPLKHPNIYAKIYSKTFFLL